MDIDTKELKLHAPLIPYVKKYYSDIMPIEQVSTNCVFTKCLWHEEDTASLALFNNGSYKCFGCGESGDIITLVQNIENVRFQEACKMIGDNVGYEVVLEPPNPDHEAYKDIMDNHTRRYWSNLQNDGEAMKYLICNRGINKQMIDLFRLGLTDREEYKYRTDIGNIGHKITFPILEHKKNPKCIGIAYRGFTDERPKYINDANQDGREGQDPKLAGVFIKGNMLYGYPMAIDSIRKNNFVYLVEGYFDVIAMHQAGITNTVGSMGTALTINQVTQLRKLTSNIVMFLDNDFAGINAMLKSLQLLYSNGFNVAICQVPGDKDPADLCKHYDFDYNILNRLIRSNTKPGIEIAINTAVEKYETIVINERTKALKSIMPIINSVQDVNIKNMYQSLLNKRLDIT